MPMVRGKKTYIERSNDGIVSESVYWLVNAKNRIVGAVSIRHRLRMSQG